MEAREYVDNLIGRLQGEKAKAQKELDGLTYEDTNFDVFVQLVKDLNKYIAEQEHTLSLIEDGAL
jgi:hypothetical protein